VPTFDPAARERAPGPLSVLLGLLTLLTAIACVAGLIIGVPIVQQYPAKVSAPDKVLGLTRVEMENVDESTGLAWVGHAAPELVALYSDDKKSQILKVVAGSGFALWPEADLDNTLNAAADLNAEIGEFVEVDAGDLGGTMKCAYFRRQDLGQMRGVLCGWGDHGSYGLVEMTPAEDRDEAARKMLDVRFAVETH
jgi:hypothetical protein